MEAMLLLPGTCRHAGTSSVPQPKKAQSAVRRRLDLESIPMFSLRGAPLSATETTSEASSRDSALRGHNAPSGVEGREDQGIDYEAEIRSTMVGQAAEASISPHLAGGANSKRRPDPRPAPTPTHSGEVMDWREMLRLAQMRQQEELAAGEASRSVLTDRFNRRHTYLRISLTERCNLRCQVWSHKRSHLDCLDPVYAELD